MEAKNWRGRTITYKRLLAFKKGRREFPEVESQVSNVSLSVPRTTRIDKRAKRRLLIINLCNPLSMGGAAIAVVLVKLLKSNIPNITVTLMPSRWRDRDVYVNRYKMKSVEFVPHIWYRERFSTAATLMYSVFPALFAFLICSVSNVLRKFNIFCKNPYDKYDIIIDLNSDSLNEHYGIAFPLFTLFNLALASLSGKPVIVCPCTIGTFKKPFMNFIVNFVLNKMSLIMVREEIGRKNLKSLSVSKPKIALAADLAFLFEPKQIKETLAGIRPREIKKPIVGIAPSQEISRYAFVQDREDLNEKYRKYIRLMAEITDFVIERINASVILIPHSLSEKDTARYQRLDDRIACRQIYQIVRNKKKTRLIDGNYRADEIKGLIGICDLFVGCRMHSVIASTSLCIPTIVLAYGEKFEGIIGRLMGQQSRVVNVNAHYETLLDQLKSKIMSTWEQRNPIRRELQERLKLVRDSAHSTILLIHESMEQKEKINHNSKTFNVREV